VAADADAAQRLEGLGEGFRPCERVHGADGAGPSEEVGEGGLRAESYEFARGVVGREDGVGVGDAPVGHGVGDVAVCFGHCHCVCGGGLVVGGLFAWVVDRKKGV
jgi:hypothetical protein